LRVPVKSRSSRAGFSRNAWTEQVYSPLIVETNQEYAELKEIVRGCLTHFHSHHYPGFAETQWSRFSKVSEPEVKPLLDVYHVLITGIHLMRTGVEEANLVRLNNELNCLTLPSLWTAKSTGQKKERWPSRNSSFIAKSMSNL